MVTAEFFDGKSAAARRVSLRVMAEVLILDDLDTKETLSYKIQDLDVTKSRGKVNISSEDIHLIILEEDFKLLHFPSKKHTSEFGYVFKFTVILVCFVLIAYAARKPLIDGVIALLPDSFLDYTAEEAVKKLEDQHCLLPDQERVLDAILFRLNHTRQDYKIFVIKSPLINAFALPGRAIVIHDQLIKEIDSPEALAGILAHEIAHIDKKHNEVMFVKNILFEMVWVLTMNQASVPEILKAFALGYFTQEEEQEADTIAAQRLRESQIAPQGVVNFFSMLQDKDPAFLKYISVSHPQYPDRIKTFTSSPYKVQPLALPVPWLELKKGCSSSTK